MHGKFTYPFRYVPSEEVVEASRGLIARLDALPSDENPFLEGKMMGVLVTDRGPLYAFSGLAGGRAIVDGFVPPVYDYTEPGGYFRTSEAEISKMSDGPAKSMASSELQDWLFSQYLVHNALGEELSIKEVFSIRRLVPPGGTGECAAPKLLEYAFRNGFKPLSMGEFWYGAPHGSEVRESGRFYPSCLGKCGPLLTWMMRGLDVEPNPLDMPYFRNEEREPGIVFVDEDIIVVDKPSGLLSVPGRGEADSLLDWLSSRYGEVHSCHRLDMDTSGLIVYARNLPSKAEMERQFAAREVRKTYRARLCAPVRRSKRYDIANPDLPSASFLPEFPHALKGTIALPLEPDYYDRPRQMVNTSSGKKAVTEYEVLEILPNGEVEIRFRPLTGRSHQIRVHAAHPLGLGRPVKGDALYGDPSGVPLHLRAESIAFKHPRSGELMEFLLTL